MLCLHVKRRMESIFKNKETLFFFVSPNPEDDGVVIDKSSREIAKMNRHCKMNISSQLNAHTE